MQEPFSYVQEETWDQVYSREDGEPYIDDHDIPAGENSSIGFQWLCSDSGGGGVRPEAYMMHYAATNGVLAPSMRAFREMQIM
ncbi:hypothetical protein J7T55_010379 [Diaporthe amygdali]|uniref:uncharacterized protein n=1 Tax=Phomopsis amygdali TaxID=1214568 RepID=UPI0022FE8819|nr:uncharacterized protein J7T55_010379 [Diaporthe amygdali]KAJ0115557.1 hypothetical protein J7T55_010379 [Diaporthe amygdali]